MSCRITQDDDGHWYIVPSDKMELFNTLVGSMTGWRDPEWEQFVRMRIDYPEVVEIIEHKVSPT